MAFYANAPLPDTNARQVAQTIRMPSSAILAIDSEDRYMNYTDALANPSTPYSFSISKSENLMAGFFTRIGVTEVVFPWAIPNINQKTNQISYTYQIGAAAPVTIPLTLPTGFYKPAELAARIQFDISANTGVNPTFTYGGGGASPIGNNSALPFFQYNMKAGNTILFSRLTPNTATYPYSANSKQLFDILGFSAANTAALQLGAGQFTYCQAVKYVDIVCNQLTYNQTVKDSMSQPVIRDTLCRIYIADSIGTNQSTVSPADPAFCPVGCAPTTLYRNFATPKLIQWLPNQNIPGFLKFDVYDDGGEILTDNYSVATVFGAMDWQMTLLATEN